MKNTSNFFDYITQWWPHDTTNTLNQLLDLNWQSETISMFGKKIIVPRKIIFMGDKNINYRYSGKDHITERWHPCILAIKEHLASANGLVFNCVLCNLYQDGNDYMGWHSDDEKSLGNNPVIASVSFGATRPFLFKDKQTQEKHKIFLESGSLLIMKNHCQKQFWHMLPKVKNLDQPRVNLTFRNVLIS